MTCSACILKIDDEERLAYGWASVFAVAGQPVIDRQSDRIAEKEAVDMAHRFMSKRVIKALHSGSAIGHLVESAVFTPDIQKALGIDLGQSGWWVGVKIDDEAAWQRIKSGELTAFSIGGSAQRTPVTESPE
jgi:hypothetical protein